MNSVIVQAPTQQLVQVNKAPPANLLKNLGDVNTSGVANNYILVYNSTTSRFEVTSGIDGGTF